MRPSHVLGMLLGLSFAAARTAAQEPDAGKDAAKAAAVDLYGDPLPSNQKLSGSRTKSRMQST